MTEQAVTINSGLRGQRFPLGTILLTPEAQELGAVLFEEHDVFMLAYLFRHAAGDWGDLGDEDKAENDLSLKQGFRLLSAYDTPAGRLWIITERDRSATTFLLPSEY